MVPTSTQPTQEKVAVEKSAIALALIQCEEYNSMEIMMKKN
jgi:hypothetical protein